MAKDPQKDTDVPLAQVACAFGTTGLVRLYKDRNGRLLLSVPGVPPKEVNGSGKEEMRKAGCYL